MQKAIYISIKPVYTKLIETGEKNYEFRNYIPKEPFDTLFVYESAPSSILKYIISIEKIIKQPDKITKKGYGNDDFNEEKKFSKYAYEIKNVYKLTTPLDLKYLKDNFNFTPPQGYAYDTRYQDLTDYLNTASKEKII